MHPQSAGEAWNFEINFFVLRHQEGFYKNSQRINHLPPKMFNLTVKLPHWSLLKRNIGPEKCYIFIEWSLPNRFKYLFSTHGQADLLKSARNFWRMNAQQIWRHQHGVDFVDGSSSRFSCRIIRIFRPEIFMFLEIWLRCGLKMLLLFIYVNFSLENNTTKQEADRHIAFLQGLQV